jgi:cephalosporin hydroxylase
MIGDDIGLGGRALFAASVADQLGRGRVIAVGRPTDAERPAHQRITYLEGTPEDPAIAAQVTAAVGSASAVVFIGLGAIDRVTAAFEAYAPLVPVDSYVVVENTVVNGRPVAPGFGPGPHEAVSQLLQRHRGFVPDVAFERYTITFNKHGYLRRTSTS